MAAIHGRSMRVYVNDVDISNMVTEITINASVDSIATSTLTLVRLPDVSVEGEVRFNTHDQPHAGPLPRTHGARRRAITIREDA